MSTEGRRQARFSVVLVLLAAAFLYLPIAVLAIYSFNASSLATVWEGFSTRWYAELAQDDELISAARLTLEIAVLTALSSAFAGGWIGYVLARRGRFRLHLLFGALVHAPMVIPEVIQGIALLLLFVTLQHLTGWPENLGLLSIWLGHTVMCASFVALVVQARVHELDPRIEEAAVNLGARPLKAFITVVLPQLSASLVSGALLSFAISADDLVLSSYLAGPGNTTLPMLVFSRIRIGLNPEMNALATLFLLVVTLAVLGMTMAARMNRQRRLHRVS